MDKLRKPWNPSETLTSMIGYEQQILKELMKQPTSVFETFPLCVTFWLCFSLAIRIRCFAGIVALRFSGFSMTFTNKVLQQEDEEITGSCLLVLKTYLVLIGLRKQPIRCDDDLYFNTLTIVNISWYPHGAWTITKLQDQWRIQRGVQEVRTSP